MDELLTPAEVSERWKIPEETLRFWRTKGEGPPSVRLGRHVRYPQRALERWLEKRTAAQAQRTA